MTGLPAGGTIRVKVIAGARKAGLEEQADGSLRIKVTAPRDQGKANAAVRAVLAERYEVPVGRVELVSGQIATQKIFRIADRQGG